MLKSIFSAIRDLIAHILPKKIARFILPKADYIFLVYLLSLKESAIKYPFAKYLPDKIIDFWGMHYWPITADSINGLLSKDNKPLKGYVIVTPLTADQMFRDVNLAQQKILKGVKLAEKMGAFTIGLGGFNSILTHDGKDLQGKVNIGITTGNTLSALVAIENIKKAAKELEVDLKFSALAVVGAAGSVGSACAKIMAKEVRKLVIIDINKAENKKLYNEILKEKLSTDIEIDSSLESLKNCDFIITATSSFLPIVKSHHLKQGAVVVDACQPKNIDPEVVKTREDVLVIDSGIAELKNIKCNLPMGLFENEVYACLGETLILASNYYKKDFSIGKVRPEQVLELYEYMNKANIKLAKFRNLSGFITQDKINVVKKIIKNKKENVLS